MLVLTNIVFIVSSVVKDFLNAAGVGRFRYSYLSASIGFSMDAL